MNRLLALAVLLLSQNSFAQLVPNLNCVITYKGQTTKMMWFAPAMAHLSDNSLEYLNVQIKEKSEPGKLEITIVEAADDAAWDKLVELTKDLPAELKTAMINLGRTRVTHAYVGLYKGTLHYEFRLGTDPKMYEISCGPNAASFPNE